MKLQPAARTAVLLTALMAAGTPSSAAAQSREAPPGGRGAGSVSRDRTLEGGRARLADASAASMRRAANHAPPAVITLELAKASIVDALRMIASQGEANLVIGPQVEGEVSVSLSNVSAIDALRAVAEGNGYVMTEENGIITVRKPSDAPVVEIVPPMLTRVFRPRSVSATDLRWALEPALSTYRDRQGQRLARITVLNEDSRPGYGIAAALNGDGSGGGTTINGSSGVSAPGLISSGGFRPGAGAAAAAGGIAGAVSGAGGTLDDPTRGVQASQVLVVTDTAEKLEEFARLVADLDRPPKQVLIEARVVEMTLTLQKQLGIDWSANIFANGPLLQHEVPLYWRSGFAQDATGAITQSLGTVDFTRFTAMVEAHQTDGGIRLLANPRLLVHNNHMASILVGERYPILRTAVTDFGTATESFEEYIPVGIQLQVTPTVLSGNRVSLLVHPATTTLGDDVVGTTGLRVARINTREIDTRAVIRDGETVVLGGLISDRRRQENRKVPGVGEVPILDWVFRQERRDDERVDLLVFLTVRVEGAEQVGERDQHVYDTYRPHFKRVTGLNDAPVQFQLPNFDQNHEAVNDEQFKERQPEFPDDVDVREGPARSNGESAGQTGHAPGGAASGEAVQFENLTPERR